MKKFLLAFLLVTAPVIAQRSALNSPVIRFDDVNGKPLSGGKLFSYIAGTTTPSPTYVDATTGAVNTNPVILDSTGSARVFLGSQVYKFVLQNSVGVVQWTADNIGQGTFQASYVNSVFGRTGAVVAVTGDYTCAQVTGCPTLPTPPTLYNQTIQVSGVAKPQEPFLNLIPGISGSIATFPVTAGGSGYAGAPAVSFSGGGCTTFPTASAVVTTGAVTGTVIITRGAGCTTPPTPVFSGGGGTGATGTTTLIADGITCVDNPGVTSTDCTFVASSGSGGSGTYGLTDVTASRSLGGVYQNTTTGILYITGSAGTTGSSTGNISVSEGVSSPSTVVYANQATATVAGGDAGFFAAILPGYFYSVTGATAVNSLRRWIEITVPSGGSGSFTLTTTGTTGPATYSGGILNIPQYTGGGGLASFNTRTGPAITLLAADVNSVGAITNSTSGNAGTSTALASTPTLCSGGFAPTGILANGNATGCAAIGGGGITALTGDIAASGSGSVVATLPTVNSTPGTCGDATHVCQNVTNGKGLVTGQTAIAITAGTTLAGDVTGPSGSNTAVKVNNGSIPASQAVVGTDGLGRFITPISQSAGSFFSGPCGTAGAPVFRGICLADLPNSSIQHLPGMSMYLDFLPQHISGSTYQDQSGSGNNATAGATPPVSTSVGIVGSATSSIDISGVLNTTRTFELGVTINPYSIPGAFSTYLGANTLIAPLFVEGYNVAPFTFTGLPALGIYDPAATTTSTNTQVYLSAGTHDIIITCGTSSGDKDRFYFDGVEVGSYAIQSFGNCGSLPTGHYVIGSNTALPGGGFIGPMYEFITRTAELTPTEAMSEHLAIQADIFLRGVGTYGLPWNTVGPFQVSQGDSLTSCQGATGGNCWTSNLALASSIAPFTLVNLGNPGKSAAAIDYSSTGVALKYCNSNNGPNIATLENGTNDFTLFPLATGVSVGATNANEIQVLSQGGCKVFVGTMIDRGNGAGATVNGFTWQQNKAALNAQLRAQAKGWGATGVMDFAADPLIGADYASGSPITNIALTSNVLTVTANNAWTSGLVVTFTAVGTNTFLNTTTCTVSATALSTTSFQCPYTHANVTSVADTGYAYNAAIWQNDQTHLQNSGYTPHMSGAASNAINYALGSSRSSPSFVSSTTYTMAAGDGYIEATIAGNAVFTLPSCIGQSGAIYTINNSTGFSITLKNSVTSQPINGVDYSSSGLVIPTNFSLWDVPNTGGSAGCHWSSAATSSGAATVVQVNGTPTSTATPVNLQTSTANTVGLTVTPSNPSAGNVKLEITGGAYTGTASNLSGTPALPNGTTATTQTLGDNTTKLATTAFVLANAGGTPAYPQTVTGCVSGGVLYGSLSTQVTCSTAGTANTLMKWGGAGLPPTISAILDNGTTVTLTENLVINVAGNGNFGFGATSTIDAYINRSAAGVIEFDGATLGDKKGTVYTYRVRRVPFTITFSTTPTIDMNNGSLQTITMTAPITAITVSNLLAGDHLTIQFCQDGTGGRTVSGATALHGLSIGTTLSTCTSQDFDSFTGTTLVASGVQNIAP